MQTFFNTATSKYHEYDDDVVLDIKAGTWTAPSGAKGICPTTLTPYTGPWPIPPTLEQAKAKQIAFLKSAYQQAIDAPVTFTNAAGVSSTYPSGDTILITGQKAKSLLSEVISAGSSAWTLGKWLDTNNVAQTFTLADLQGLAGAMEAAITLDYTDLVAKIAQVNAATTVGEVQSVTW